ILGACRRTGIVRADHLASQAAEEVGDLEIGMGLHMVLLRSATRLPTQRRYPSPGFGAAATTASPCFSAAQAISRPNPADRRDEGPFPRRLTETPHLGRCSVTTQRTIGRPGWPQWSLPWGW